MLDLLSIATGVIPSPEGTRGACERCSWECLTACTAACLPCMLPRLLMGRRSAQHVDAQVQLLLLHGTAVLWRVCGTMFTCSGDSSTSGRMLMTPSRSLEDCTGKQQHGAASTSASGMSAARIKQPKIPTAPGLGKHAAGAPRTQQQQHVRINVLCRDIQKTTVVQATVDKAS